MVPYAEVVASVMIPGGFGRLERDLFVDMRHDPVALIELVRQLLAGCTTEGRGGWLIPPLCGWLELRHLQDVETLAREHLEGHPGCHLAEDIVAHVSLRAPRSDTPPVLHVAFPEALIEQWTSTYPYRTEQPTWLARADAPATATIGGAAIDPCPRCGGPPECLLTLRAEHSDAIAARPEVQFAWCLRCSPFADVTFARIGSSGQGELLAPEVPEVLADLLSEVPPRPPVDLMEVGLIDLGPEWRQQDWGRANHVENLCRVGGQPTWIQYEDTPRCVDCGTATVFVAQIPVEDFSYGEGIAYLHWCDTCAIAAVIHQQT